MINKETLDQELQNVFDSFLKTGGIEGGMEEFESIQRHGRDARVLSNDIPWQDGDVINVNTTGLNKVNFRENEEYRFKKNPVILISNKGAFKLEVLEYNQNDKTYFIVKIVAPGNLTPVNVSRIFLSIQSACDFISKIKRIKVVRERKNDGEVASYDTLDVRRKLFPKTGQLSFKFKVGFLVKPYRTL